MPGSALPAITAPITIDASTQPGTGYSADRAQCADAGSTVDGLNLDGGNATVRGLIINRFSEDGIRISGAGGDIITGNYIGTAANGTAALGNSGYGVEVQTSGNTIGGTAASAGNLISGNTESGIGITGDGSFLVSENNAVQQVDNQTGAILATYSNNLPPDMRHHGSGRQSLCRRLPGQSDPALRCQWQRPFPDRRWRAERSAGNGLRSRWESRRRGQQQLCPQVQPIGNLSGDFHLCRQRGPLQCQGHYLRGPDGNAYVVSWGTNSVLSYNGTTGAFIGTFVSSGSGGLSSPEGLTFGPDGNLYVSSYSSNSVLRYSGANGAFLGNVRERWEPVRSVGFEL